MTRVAVKPEFFLWAQERSGLSGDALRKTFDQLDHWQNGDRQPTLRQLEKFARTTYTPLGYFFLDKPPHEELGLTDFRTFGGKAPRRPSPALLDTIHAMTRRQDWLREHLESSGADRLQFIGSATTGDSPIAIARQMRQHLGWHPEKSRSAESWSKALSQLCQAIEHLI